MADQGSNYWLIGGGESPAPPTQTPPTTPVFGPVTASGYAIPPVDPMSYYSSPSQDYFSPVVTPSSTPSGISLADIASIIAPATHPSNPVTPVPTPSNPATPPAQPAPEPEPPTPGPSGPLSNDEFPGYPGMKIGDEVPGMPGVKIGDPFYDNEGNRWDWRKGEWIPVKPVVQPPYKNEEGSIVYPGTTSPIVVPPTYVVTTPVTQPPSEPTVEPPTKPPIEVPGSYVTSTPVAQYEERVNVTVPTREEFQFNEPAPVRTPIVLPGTSVISRPATTPAPTLPTVPTEITRKTPAYRTGFQYINYDPEEILAAAMRSMGGSRARQSIAEEAQIFNRMRNR